MHGTNGISIIGSLFDPKALVFFCFLFFLVHLCLLFLFHISCTRLCYRIFFFLFHGPHCFVLFFVRYIISHCHFYHFVDHLSGCFPVLVLLCNGWGFIFAIRQDFSFRGFYCAYRFFLLHRSLFMTTAIKWLCIVISV